MRQTYHSRWPSNDILFHTKDARVRVRGRVTLTVPLTVTVTVPHSVRVRVRASDPDPARVRLTIHHKFRSNLVELRQNACRDGAVVADVTRHGAWAGMALLGARPALERPQRMGTSTADASSAIAC